MSKIIKISHCAICPFNEHGTAKTEFKGLEVDMPALYCTYNPKRDFRDNVRQLDLFKPVKMICISGNSEYDGEFEKQLIGFPDWCPLEDKK